jgi:hypothetical protein
LEDVDVDAFRKLEDDGEWCEYHDDEDRDICEIMREEEA